MIGVCHAKTLPTPGIRQRSLKEADEKLVDETGQKVFRAIVGKAQWILRARPDVLYAVKEQQAAAGILRRRLRGSQEDGETPTWHARHGVGAQASQRSTASGQRHRQKLGRMSNDEGVNLGSSLCRTQGLTALSSPEAEYYACTVGVAEAKFVQSTLLDWCTHEADLGQGDRERERRGNQTR